MASDAYKEMQASNDTPSSSQPKHKQLIKMLTFRVVPAYYKDIEKVANHQEVTVSKLIRKSSFIFFATLVQRLISRS